MKYRGTLLVVKDCKTALKFYRDLFGFELVRDNDGNMELTGGVICRKPGIGRLSRGKARLRKTTARSCISKRRI